MSKVEFISTLIVISTALKIVFDFHFSQRLYEKDKRSGKETVDAASAKKTRDKVAAWLVFGVVTALSVYSMGENAMGDKELNEKLDSIVKRVDAIEQYLFKNPNNSFPPNGGGPGLVSRQTGLLDELFERLEAIQKEFVTKEEFDEIVRILCENETTNGRNARVIYPKHHISEKCDVSVPAKGDVSVPAKG